MRGNGLNLHQDKFGLDTSKNFFTARVVGHLKQGAQGSGAIITQEIFKKPM